MNQKKIKIAFLHRANDPYVLERIQFFIDNNYDVYSISSHEKSNSSLINGVKYYSLKRYKIDKIPFVRRFSHYYELKKILQSIKPDIFHIKSALNLFYSNYDFNNVKVIENQGSDLLLTPKKYKILKTYYKHFYKKVDGVIQDSKILFEHSIKFGANKYENHNQIIENGIDFEIYNKKISKDVIRNRYDLKKRPIILHTRGITDKLYNVDIVVQSLYFVKKYIPNIIYIFTTEFDKMSEDLMKFIKDKKLLKNLLFVGFQDRKKNLKYFYKDANIVVSVPSSDSSPFAVYESMACMTPVIVSDLPWLYDKFIPNKHLLTVPKRDVLKLSEAIIKVLRGDYKMDLNSAYDVVFNRINLQNENKKLENFYNYLLVNKNVTIQPKIVL